MTDKTTAERDAAQFTACDMATASAQGFRDGRASLPLPGAQEPMFWVRICSDGLYEGPIHNARIEEVRRQSGAWSPLFLAAPQPALSAGWVSAIEAVAKMLEKKADDFAEAHGSDDMGGLSFCCGAHADAKLDYHSGLLELAEEVRALPASPTIEGESK